MSRHRVRVTSIVDGGHFRAGRHWPDEATEAEISQEHYDALESDNRLRVVYLAELEGKSEDGGTPLRGNFPARGKLVEARLGTVELVAEASIETLLAAGLSEDQIKKVRESLPMNPPL